MKLTACQYVNIKLNKVCKAYLWGFFFLLLNVNNNFMLYSRGLVNQYKILIKIKDFRKIKTARLKLPHALLGNASHVHEKKTHPIS